MNQISKVVVSVALPQEPAVDEVLVAFLRLYVAGEYVVPDVNTVAPEQTSLLGDWLKDLNEQINPITKKIMVA